MLHDLFHMSILHASTPRAMFSYIFIYLSLSRPQIIWLSHLSLCLNLDILKLVSLIFLHNMYNQVLQLRLCTLGEFFLLTLLLEWGCNAAAVWFQIVPIYRTDTHEEISCFAFLHLLGIRKDTLCGHSCDLVKRFWGKTGECHGGFGNLLA